VSQHDEVAGPNEIETAENKAVSRRKMMAALGAGGLGALVGSLALAQPGLNEASAQFTRIGPSDVDILNFALNLEYLEAEFYQIAVTNDRLPSNLTSGPGEGTVTGGGRVRLVDTFAAATARELRADEINHVAYLRTVITKLGGTPVGRPSINLGAAGFGFANLEEFLVLSRIFEDVGVSAYGGAAPLISSPTVLGAAARILAVEAYHAGNIRLQLVQHGLLGDSVDGKDQPPTLQNLIPTVEKGLAVIRTVPEVLALVNPFFPNGLNGTIH
jgi:hypothetical protein